MSFFNKAPVQKFTLVVGLKSSSVDIQLVSESLQGKREVLLAQRAIIFLGDSQDPTEYTEKCMSQLVTLLKDASVEICRIIQKNKLDTRVVLHAPWFTSHITEHHHNKELVLSDSFLKKNLDSIEVPSKLIRLENKVIKILTNGYSITEFSRNKLQNVTLQIYSSYISTKIHEQIEKSITGPLTCVDTIKYQTNPLLMFEQIKKLLIKEDNICFVYIGGEITEVGIIEDDSLSYYGTFPIGKHDFLRELQETARSYDYDLLYQKEIQIKTKKKELAFESLKQQWKKSLNQSLSESENIIPSKILVISDSKTRDFFSKLVIQQFDEVEQKDPINYRIINFDISHLKDIILYKTPTNTNELDLQLEALI